MARPRIIKSPKQFNELADAYFAECDAKEEPYTVTGLALGLGLSSRASLDEYEKRAGFFNSVKSAKMRVENSYEKSLRGGGHPSGPIFALKNFGWSDRMDLTSSDKSMSPAPAVAVDLGNFTPGELIALAKNVFANGGDESET